MQQTYRKTLMSMCDFNTVAKQFYWTHTSDTSAWVFSCKFSTYFQDTFLWEQLWRTASEGLTSSRIRIAWEYESYKQNIGKVLSTKS